MKWGRQACAIAAVFVLLLVVGQPGRVEAVRSYRDGGANISATATTTMDPSADGSKFSVRACVPRDCKTRAEPGKDFCICCMILPDLPCFHSMTDCHENCPACTPNCPSPPAKELHV
uniref:Uncharacterized protein n=1 Tax=Avena sativa TaxID=4498 RepID=A0ACD5T7J1_AVESA